MNRTKSAVRRQFTRQAGAYAASRSHAEGSDLDALIDLLQLRDGDVALDVATGPGFVAVRLAGRAARVVGLDLTAEMLRQAGQRLHQGRAGHVRLVQGDAEALPFAGGAFDVVTCRRSAHHFPDIAAAVAEMTRVLRPGGRLGIVDQVSPEDEPGDALQEALERARDGSHVRAMRTTEWGRLVEDAGLRLRTLEVHEEPETVAEWLGRSDAGAPARREVARLLAAASPAALRSIGYRDGDEPAFMKRRVVLLAQKP